MSIDSTIKDLAEMKVEIDDRVDLKAPINEICERLGLNPNDVGSITLTPTEALVEVFLTNDQGSKYVDDKGEAATKTLTFKTRTYEASRPKPYLPGLVETGDNSTVYKLN